ncbi:MAG: hypothetical protein HQ513_08160 [Rhodospirillales bacterium]|nr:hypothetical protein [Rhodospirillales bacterium]
MTDFEPPKNGRTFMDDAASNKTIWLILFALSFVVVAKFEGVNLLYRQLFMFVRDPGLLPNDWYLTNSIYLKGSIIYKFFDLTGIMIENDFVAVAVHLIISAVAIYFAYKVVRGFFGLEDRETSLLVVLLGSFLFYKFTLTTRASITGIVSPSPTAIAHTIAYSSLYFMLSRRIFIASLIVTLALAVASKGNFILVPALALYVIINKELSLRNLAFLAIPLAYMLFASGRADIGGLSYEELVKLCEAAIWREGPDAVFGLQPSSALFLITTAFLVAPFVIKQFENPSLKALSWSFYIVSVAGFIVGYMYTAFAYKIYPNPMFVLLAPPRAMKFFVFLFCMMLFVMVLKTERLFWHEKVIAIFSLVLLKGMAWITIAFPAALLFAGIGVPRLIKHFFDMDVARLPGGRPIAERLQKIRLPTLMTVLLIVFVAIRAPISYPAFSDIDTVGFRQNNSWSTNFFADDDAWAAFRLLKKEPGYNSLLVFYQKYNRPGEYVFDEYPNTIAGKTFFIADTSHHYLSPAGWDEAFLRELVVMAFQRNMNDGIPVAGAFFDSIKERKFGKPIKVNVSLEDFLKKRSANVMVPKELEHLFPPDVPKKNFGKFVVFSFSSTS